MERGAPGDDQSGAGPAAVDLTEATTVMRVLTLEQAGAKAAAVGAILGVLVFIARYLLAPVWKEWREERKFRRQFRDDWQGVPDRPGVPGRPGVMTRLATVTEGFQAMADEVRSVKRSLLTLKARVDYLFEVGGHKWPSADEERVR